MKMIDEDSSVDVTRRDIRIFLKGYFFAERPKITDSDIDNLLKKWKKSSLTLSEFIRVNKDAWPADLRKPKPKSGNFK